MVTAATALSVLVPAAADARQAVGVYKRWAAFRDDAPTRCFAVSRPADLAPGASPAFASVATWPTRRTFNQVYLRLAREARKGSAILLAVDDRVFQLAGRGFDAWAPGPAVDRAIVAAMRTGVQLRVTTRDARGNRYGDSYALTGAATAIDAAALACRKDQPIP